jgi:hypothetical protein
VQAIFFLITKTKNNYNFVRKKVVVEDVFGVALRNFSNFWLHVK